MEEKRKVFRGSAGSADNNASVAIRDAIIWVLSHREEIDISPPVVFARNGSVEITFKFQERKEQGK